ncbi:MAG: 50S ribosomal protein L22 [Mycoplasmataceae bacterium]|jgi:ribosomal protein L22|nr:50S ribosomal protein L22 [Mycoplasmataceae bacterium]
MKTQASQDNIHVSSRKAGLVCALIRNKKVTEAQTILENVDKKTAIFFKKLLHSAIANATNNHQAIGKNLYVYQAFANQGKTIKRSLPRARGSANMIRKRHTNLVLVLSDDKHQKIKDQQALLTKHNKIKTKPGAKIITKATSTIKHVDDQHHIVLDAEKKPKEENK